MLDSRIESKVASRIIYVCGRAVEESTSQKLHNTKRGENDPGTLRVCHVATPSLDVTLGDG